MILVHFIDMKLMNKHIVVAVTGGIAAYKSAEFIRSLQREGAQVRVAMTHSATKFVTPLTFQALSGNPVHVEDDGVFDPAGMDHIALSRWSDAVVIVPATANIIAKISQGISDDFVSALCLAHDGLLAVAPSMNQAMWTNPATQQNIATLNNRGILIFGPDNGLQACGESGEGRMMEPSDLVQQCMELFSHQILSNKKVVITAGPTIEPIDPVRFISNRSSGKMGYALAIAAYEAGANVTVISGPTHLSQHPKVDYQHVETANEMYEATLAHLSDADIFIAAAAVADYRPTTMSSQKIKKQDSQQMSIHLTRNKDILREAKQAYPQLFCVGFAAETENVIENAKSKLDAKALDLIIANKVGLVDQGFDSDFNAIEVISRDSHVSVARSRKTQIAQSIIDSIISNLELTTKDSNNVTYFVSK